MSEAGLSSRGRPAWAQPAEQCGHHLCAWRCSTTKGDVVTALPDLEPDPRRRCAVGIAQIAINEPLCQLDATVPSWLELRRYLPGFTGVASARA